MLYKRSSFLSWLSDVKDCDVNPIRDTNVVIIKNGPASARMWIDTKDRIDYEEIWLICNKLYIDGLPGEKELTRIE